jgi:hypothetical protein
MNSISKRQQLATGSILILLGIGFFALQVLEGFGDAAVLFLIGAACIAGYLFWNAYGWLIAGGILMGIGLDSVGESSGLAFGDFSPIGLGLGFVSIYAIDFVYRGRTSWWPLIPGGVLILSGLASGNEVFQRLLSIGWPLTLIFIGLLLLAGAFGFTGRKDG